MYETILLSALRVPSTIDRIPDPLQTSLQRTGEQESKINVSRSRLREDGKSPRWKGVTE